MGRVFLSVLLTLAVGCGGITKRAEPSDVQGKVTLPGNMSPKDLTITFQPLHNAHPGGAKIDKDGSFTVKLTPGTYAYYFEAEVNAVVPTYKKMPPTYTRASADRVVSVSSGSPILIEIK